MPEINSYINLAKGTTNVKGQEIPSKFTEDPWKVSGTTSDSTGKACYILTQADPSDSSKTMRVTVYPEELSDATPVSNQIKVGDKVAKSSGEDDNKPTSYTVLNYDEKTRTAITSRDGKVTGTNLNASDLDILARSYIKEKIVVYDEDVDDSNTTSTNTSTDSTDSDSDNNDTSTDGTDGTGDTVGVTDNSTQLNSKITSDVRIGNITYIKENDKDYVLASTDQGEIKIPVEDFNQYVSDANDALVFEEQLITLLKGTVGDKQLYYYSSRLFGIPHQFNPYTDYRLLVLDGETRKPYELAGRKFIENIMLDAPVLTVIPGKPLYLPGNKDKQASTVALLQASNGSLSLLAASNKISDSTKLAEKLRYYDFQPDYFNYMKYVNVMCATAAVFLDLGDTEIDGVKFTKYDWKNYRWLSERYSTTIGRIGSELQTNILKKVTQSTTVDKFKTYSGPVLENLSGSELAGVGGLEEIDEVDTDTATETDADNSDANQEASEADTAITETANSTDDNDLLSTLESMLTSINYVQFYIDSTSGLSESASNSAGDSQLAGVFSSASDLAKEINFVIASGGADTSKIQEAIDGGLDSLSSSLTDSTTGTFFSSVLTRIMSNAGNVVKGETMVFPKIYQSSEYAKSYSININLVCIYGNKLSYFLNVLVPLFHILGLVLPKQSSPNTYSTPFLIRAYYPGTFSCNLGLSLFFWITPITVLPVSIILPTPPLIHSIPPPIFSLTVSMTGVKFSLRVFIVLPNPSPIPVKNPLTLSMAPPTPFLIPSITGETFSFIAPVIFLNPSPIPVKNPLTLSMAPPTIPFFSLDTSSRSSILFKVASSTNPSNLLPSLSVTV